VRREFFKTAGFAYTMAAVHSSRLSLRSIRTFEDFVGARDFKPIASILTAQVAWLQVAKFG
jgi:hypothetical protein